MPLKRKDRPELWSLNASSPKEKKTWEKNHSALERESEENILKVLNMADNLGSKVELILNRLNKLDSIEVRLEKCVQRNWTVLEEMPKELYELRKAKLRNCRMQKREVTQRTLVKNMQISFS